jgi:hypothetical protein
MGSISDTSAFPFPTHKKCLSHPSSTNRLMSASSTWLICIFSFFRLSSLSAFFSASCCPLRKSSGIYAAVSHTEAKPALKFSDSRDPNLCWARRSLAFWRAPGAMPWLPTRCQLVKLSESKCTHFAISFLRYCSMSPAGPDSSPFSPGSPARSLNN